MATREARAVTFTVWDVESGNAVAHYDSWEAAGESIQAATASHPEQVEILAVVAYDKQGHALETRLATDLVAPA